MKKVFLIGKFNTTFESINNYLNRHFSVQVCVDNHEMIKGILKLNKPDIIVISMTEMKAENSRIFNEIGYNYSQIPVICIGSIEEQLRFEEFMYMSQFRMVTSPIANETILEMICGVLQLKYDSESGIVIDEKESKKCVMLVDDNAFQIKVLGSILKEKYDVQLATSGMQALTLIGKRKPDLIFLDYEMPMCDGKMTFQMIREVEEAKDIPVVFLTGVKDQEHMQAVLDLNPAAYLIKPATADMIYKMTDKYLENK